MAVEIKRVKYMPELRQVAELASEIWHDRSTIWWRSSSPFRQ